MVRRSRRILELLFGASLIYTAMAACGGGGTQNGGSAGGHAHGGAGQGGSGHGGAAVGGSDGSGSPWTPSPIPSARPTPSPRAARASRPSTSRASMAHASTCSSPRRRLPYANVPVTQSVWFDSMRNEDCVFRLAADGKLRCLPGVIDSSGTPPTAAYGVRSMNPQCTGQAYVFMPAPPVNCQTTTRPTMGSYRGRYADAVLERTPGSTAARVQGRRAHAEPEHAELPPHGQSARVQQHRRQRTLAGSRTSRPRSTRRSSPR